MTCLITCVAVLLGTSISPAQEPLAFEATSINAMPFGAGSYLASADRVVLGFARAAAQVHPTTLTFGPANEPGRLWIGVQIIPPPPPGMGIAGSMLSSLDDVSLSLSTLREVVAFAYDVAPRQVLGGDEWVDSAKIRVIAHNGRFYPPPEVRSMLRKMLAEMFQARISVQPRAGSDDRDLVVIEHAILPSQM